MKRSLLICLFTALSLHSIGAEILEGEFLFDPQQALFTGLLNDPFNPGPGEDDSDAQAVIDESVALLLEAARWSFSGMIYGYNFVYVPQNSASGVAESFIWEPVALIPYGDPDLSVISVDRREDGLILIRLSYRLSGDEKVRHDSWKSNVFVHISGSGTASFYDEGYMQAAIGNSLKEGIRAYLRSVEYNKPREVRGRVALTSVPQFGYRSGECSAYSRMAVKIDHIRSSRSP